MADIVYKDSTRDCGSLRTGSSPVIRPMGRYASGSKHAICKTVGVTLLHRFESCPAHNERDRKVNVDEIILFMLAVILFILVMVLVAT